MAEEERDHNQLFAAGRRWIAESAIGITPVGAEVLTPTQVVDIVGNAFDGGWKAFVADHRGGA